MKKCLLLLAVAIFPQGQLHSQQERRDRTVEERLPVGIPEQARGMLPEGLVDQPGRLGPTGGAIIRKPWRAIETPRRERPDKRERAGREERSDAIEIEPVPNRNEVYRRLMEELLEQGWELDRDRIPRRYEREMQERFNRPRDGEQRDREQPRRRPRGRNGAEAEVEQVEAIPAESITRRLRDELEEEEPMRRQPDRSGEADLREEYRRLIEQRLENLPAEKLRETVIRMKTDQILSDLERLGRLKPQGLAGVKSYLAARVLMTDDVDRLREVARMLEDGRLQRDR